MMLSVHVDGAIFSRQPHGGISRVFIELLKAWSRRNDVVTHLYLEPEVNPEPYRSMVDSMTWLPSRRLRKGERYLGGLYNAMRDAATRRVWASARNGVFISTYYTSPAGLTIPRIVLLHDTIYEDYPEHFVKPKDQSHRDDKHRCMREASGIITPSESAMKDGLRCYEPREMPRRVIPYAVSNVFLSDADPAVAQSLCQRLTGGQPFLLFMGGRGGHKNFNRLLEAFARAELPPGLKLLAVGGGSTDAEESSLMKTLGLENRVHFGGSLSDDELAEVVKAARAVVVPSLCEGYGFPVIEAMAAGRPVACSTGGSLPEVGRDVPLYFDPHDDASMAEALREVVSIAEDDARLARGRAIARARTWDDVAADFIAFAREVVDAV